MKTIQEMYQTMPSLREMMYGKKRVKYAPKSLSQGFKRDRLIQQLTSIMSVEEYNKFTNDISKYDWTQPKPIKLLDVMHSIDFKDIQKSLLKKSGFICYDLTIKSPKHPEDVYSIYIVNIKGQNYICFYLYRYYFKTSHHPPTKLLFVIPIQRLK